MTQTSLVKRTREAKKNAAVAVIAMKLAKDADDIQQKKAAKFKKLFLASKEAILRKYGPRARVAWTKKQSTASNVSVAPKAPSNKPKNTLSTSNKPK